MAHCLKTNKLSFARHAGTWSVIDKGEIGGNAVYLLENDIYDTYHLLAWEEFGEIVPFGETNCATFEEYYGEDK